MSQKVLSAGDGNFLVPPRSKQERQYQKLSNLDSVVTVKAKQSSLSVNVNDLQQRIEEIKKMGEEKSKKDMESARLDQVKKLGSTPRAGSFNLGSNDRGAKTVFNLRGKGKPQAIKQKVVYDQSSFDDFSNLRSGDSTLTSKPSNGKIQKLKSIGIVSNCLNAICCRKKQSLKYQADQDEDSYLEATNENDYSDYPRLSSMSRSEREQRLLELWYKAYLKARGAYVILETFQNLGTKIQLFGRQLLVNNKKKQDEGVILQKSCPLIIMPQSRFKLVWNLVIICLLLYTATYMPYHICFIDEPSTGFYQGFEYLVDILFFLDIFVNFVSALELNDGSIDPRFKSIAMAYIKTWFFLDIFATFPTQFLEGGSQEEQQVVVDDGTGETTVILNQTKQTTSKSYNKLLRLARLPRLYRLIRILRLFKIAKIMRFNQSIQRMLDKIKMNAAITRMIFTLVFAFFSVHLISCFWYLAAKFDDLNPDTWVARMNLQDQPPTNLYLECLYWSLQTVATVGFGDFGAFTIAELFICIVWMIFGVGFYSFVIGNLTSIIANENANSENLYNKLKALEEFAKKTKLPEELHFKIRQFLENNYNELFSRIDENQLLQELPITLRDEVFIHKYQGLLDTIDFLRECENNEFVWAMVQLLRKIKVDKEDVVYWEGDFAEEIYFIKQGKIKLYAENGFPFASYKEGQHFGDPEGIHHFLELIVLFKETRDGKAVAQTDCLFYAIHKDDLDKLMDQHPDMKKIIYDQAKVKKDLHKDRKEQASKVQPVYGLNNQNKGANFLAQAKRSKFVTSFSISSLQGMPSKTRDALEIKDDKNDDETEPFLKKDNPLSPKTPKLPLSSSNKAADSDSKQKTEPLEIVKPQEEEDKSTVPSSQQNEQEQGRYEKGHAKKKSQDFLNKKKERMSKVLVNVDALPDFTKNVSTLLKSSPDQIKGLRDYEDPILGTDSAAGQFQKQKGVEELKKVFKNKNKVATLESYEKKKNEQFSIYSTANIQIPSAEELIEQDDTLGDPDAEQGLENLARFNEDMSMIALNVYQVYNLFDLIGKENEEIISWMHSLEKQTIQAEERQAKVEKKLDSLINTLS